MTSIRHLIWISIFMCCSLYLTAQKSAELYIPIGKSPGVSGEYSILGMVESIDWRDSTITVKVEGVNKTIEIKGRPQVMLDYSNLKQTNKMGSLQDIPTGVLVEVKHRNNEPGQPIEWIKCQMEN